MTRLVENKKWEYLKLEELFDFVIGGDWGLDPNEIFDNEYITAVCIRGSEIKYWSKEKGGNAAKRKIKNSSLEKRKLKEGDILLEISGGGPDQPVGRTVYIDKETLEINPQFPKVCSNFLRLVRLKDSVEKKFIDYYLKKFYLSGEVINYQGGSNNLRNLKFKEYAKIDVPLPPKSEQMQISEKLDDILGHLDIFNTRLDHIPRFIKAFKKRILTDAISGKLTEKWRDSNTNSLNSLQEFKHPSNKNFDNIELAFNPSYKLPPSWKIMPMKNVCVKITDGTHDTPKSIDSGIPYITAQHIRDQRIDFDKCFFLSQKDHDEIYRRCNPEKNDVLIVNIGAGSATPAMVNVDFEFSMKNIALLKPEKKYLLGKYLEIHQLHFKQIIFDTITRGGAQPFLSLKLLKSLPLILPPIDEQRAIVTKVQKLFNIVDILGAKHEKLRTIVEILPKGILNKAFEGKLV